MLLYYTNIIVITNICSSLWYNTRGNKIRSVEMEEMDLDELKITAINLIKSIDDYKSLKRVLSFLTGLKKRAEN